MAVIPSVFGTGSGAAPGRPHLNWMAREHDRLVPRTVDADFPSSALQHHHCRRESGYGRSNRVAAGHPRLRIGSRIFRKSWPNPRLRTFVCSPKNGPSSPTSTRSNIVFRPRSYSASFSLFGLRTIALWRKADTDVVSKLDQSSLRLVELPKTCS
jgi:hypothetical protein